jgi:hypothetical protein
MRNKEASIVPQYNPKKLEQPKKYINTDAAIMRGWQQDGNHANVFASIRFVQHGFECFSQWAGDEMTLFWDFIRIIHQTTWADLYRSAGKGINKVGLGYTVINTSNYPEAFTKELDPGITLFELRVSQRARVHCFRDSSICYICFLDKDHRLT